MNTVNFVQRILLVGRSRLILLVAFLIALGQFASSMQAQLAVTEAMSFAAQDRADFWELTNFGTNTIDLTGYKFTDGDKDFPDNATSDPFEGVSIAPGESIIFVRALSGIADRQEFFAWWGETNLHADLQVLFYPKGYGLDQVIDGVQIGDPSGRLIDRADLTNSLMGRTFTYDTCGVFVQTELGGCGAFTAANGPDVGSPGTNVCNPVPIRITSRPTNQTLNAGSSLTLCVCVCALPKPQFRWLRNGLPIEEDTRISGVSTSGVLISRLTIRQIRPEEAGQYSIEIVNGLERIVSDAISVTVRPITTPASINMAPQNITVTTNQNIVLSVVAEGYPVPTYQWFKNDIPITGATNDSWYIEQASWSDSGTYCVEVSNEHGTTNACAIVQVRRKGRLQITEAMSSPCTNTAVTSHDWWELTNLDNHTINLRGFRWDDKPATNVLAGNIIGCTPNPVLPCTCEPPPTMCRDVFIRPGESIIFVEALTREQFLSWWGAGNLPTDIQVLTYFANGLDSDGDRIRLWDDTATHADDFIDRIQFSTATTGTSWWFDTGGCTYIYGNPSIVGECGAFEADAGCDIGSPGWNKWSRPRFANISIEVGSVILSWIAPPRSTNTVEYSSDLATWSPLGHYTSSTSMHAATDSTAGNSPQRFYRINPADCLCYVPPFE